MGYVKRVRLTFLLLDIALSLSPFCSALLAGCPITTQALVIVCIYHFLAALAGMLSKVSIVVRLQPCSRAFGRLLIRG